MRLENYGKDERAKAAESFLRRRLRTETARRRAGFYAEEQRLVLLPIPSTADGIHLRGSERLLAELLGDLSPGDAIAGYGLPEGFLREGDLRGIRIEDLASDRAFTEENARLTAIGMLGILLTRERRAPCDLKIGILGYGRIGRELLRLLLLLGARVTVFTSRQDKRLLLGRLGIHTLPSAAEEPTGRRFSGLDLLINTAPARLVLPSEGQVLSRAKIYELASGENFPEGLPVERLPSLPAKMFPESAGRLYAGRILALLREEEKT